MLRTSPILNTSVLEALSRVGHGQVVIIADAGLPNPLGVPVIDLAWTAGVPGFVDVARTILRNLAVESYVVAAESDGTATFAELEDDLDALPAEVVSHELFKERLPDAAVIIRTGECSPYANIALVGGVTF